MQSAENGAQDTALRNFDNQNVEMKDLSSNQKEAKNYKALQAVFEGYEQVLKQGKNTDYQHIVMFVNTFLPKYFKFILARKYNGYQMATQIIVTKFLNNWLRMRMPQLEQNLIQLFDQQAENKDPLIRCYGIQKEFEILESIFDDRNDYYNIYCSRNNSETEVLINNSNFQQESLNRIKDEILNKNIDSNASMVQIEQQIAIVGKPSSVSYFYVHNINMFHLYSGFDQILRVFKVFEAQSSNSQEKQGPRKPLLKIISLILSMLTNIKYYLRENFLSDYINQLKDLLHSSIMNNCSPEDMRILNKKETQYLIGSIESILDWNRGLKLEDKIETVYKISDQIELHFAMICLQMPVLEKKIVGHNIIGNKISKIKSAIHFAAYSNPNAQNIHLRWINTERLVQWINDNKIFDLIFGDSLHSEVIKKSVPLLEFMYDHNCIKEREFDKMWDCVVKKHEAFKVAILRALSIITARANLKDIIYIFKKVQSLQLNEVDKFTLNLVKALARRVSGDEGKSNSQNQASYNDTKINNLQNGRNSGLARSSSETKETKGGKSRADDFRKQVQRTRNSNTRLNDLMIQGQNKDLSQNQNSNEDAVSHSKNKSKRTRSLSGGEDLNIRLDIQQNKVGVNFNQKAKIIQEAAQANQMFEKPRQTNTANRQRQEVVPEIQENENPLEVPADKEDKKTADEDGSFGDNNDFTPNDIGANAIDDLFDYQGQNNSNSAHQANQQVQNNQLDEEEVKGDDGSNSLKEQIKLNIRLMITDDSLGIEDYEKRQIASQILEYIWHFCLEETVLQHNLSLQIHKLGVETFVEVLTLYFPKAILPYVSKCISYLHHNYSVTSLQMLIQRLLSKISMSFERGKQMPKNRQEFIQYVDEELSIANICLSSYIEFKRVSLSRILEQFGSQEQEQDLETQSSLDNEDEKTSVQSVQKSVNPPQGQNQSANMNIQDHSQQITRDQLISVQDDHTNQSSGSLFISPRGGRNEEEFKVPMPQKTQSYQGEMLIQGSSQRNNDFTSLANRDQDSTDDWFQKNNQNVQLGTTGSQTVGNRHFSSQKKPNQSNRITDMTPGNQMTQNQNENNTEMLQQNPPQQNNNRDFLNQLITNEVYHFSYYQDMQHRLDFLKFYFGNCPQILKPQQIQVVWECLVVNAFYEKERDQFFNWCTQILKLAQNLPGARDIDNIGGASIFKDDCLEMLFFDTLLKLDFRFITETMYECFERFMIYINEQYGQIMTNSTFESAFEVFDTKLIGAEALWEITLCARSDKVYQKSAEFLHKLYKKMSPTLVEKLNSIKEDLLTTCMDQIKCGLNEIKNEAGNDLYDLPLYQLSENIEDPKNRIARSISQLCKFIDEFEGLRDRGAKSKFAASEKEISIICNNNINSCNPKKIHLTVNISTKIGSIREQVAGLLNPSKKSDQICLTFKGKDQNEDLKALKDLGVGDQDSQVIMFVTLRNEYEMEAQQNKDSRVDEIANEILNFGIEQPFEIIKLAVKKSGLNIEEAFLMLTEEDKVNDLQEDLRKQEQAQNQILILEDKKEDNEKEEDSKLNLIISNRSEYFDLLFELLNLGINEITLASWNLLLQIPVNKNLLNSIRNLSIVQQGNWTNIIDQANIYKMLYSLQIVNSFISVNNEKLSESEIQERYEWRERFLELGGFDHLYHIIIGLDLDEVFIDQDLQIQRGQAQSSKKRQRGALGRGKQESQQEFKSRQQIQNNSAKCLGYLISIIKIFIQAALLTDSDNLMTIIAQTSTSPFRKPKNIKSALQQIGPNKLNQMMFTNERGGSVSGNDVSMADGFSRDNSSVNTPKFHSNHSSNIQTPDSQTPNDPQEKNFQNKSVDTIKSQQTFNKADQQSADQLYTVVDDFPRLVEQMSGGVAKNLLDKVINFNALISKLLYIIQKATLICDSKEVSNLVQNSLDLLLPCVVWRPNLLLKEIYEFEHLESLLINTLMFSSNENVRRSLEKTFKTICSGKMPFSSLNIQNEMILLGGEESEQRSQSQLQIESPKIYILKILLKNMPDVGQKSDQCEEYFNLLTHLIKECHQNFQCIPKANISSKNDHQISKSKILVDNTTFSSIDLLEWCITQLKLRPTYEDKYSNYTDKILAGYMQLTQSVLEIDSQLKYLTVKDSSCYNLVQIVFDFLFLLPSVEEQQRKHRENDSITSNDYPKCKRKFTRKKAFNLLLTLCHQCKPNYIQLLEELYRFHAQIKNFDKVVNIKDIDLDQSARSGIGYVGLMNFAATCYMNSLIQQLFMIPDLRQGILRAQINDENLDQNVVQQLKLTFANLQESEKQYYAPQGFTNAFKFYGEPVNVRVQQDTHEFYNILCENVEDILKGTASQNVLKDTVGGVIGNETKSQEADYPYIGEREENFFAISLDIKNKKNLAEALDLYIKPDFLEGDNKYFCEKHNTKVNAQRRSFLKKLSNTVIINLKRFDFDYNSMTRQKVNDYCEFPTKINFKPWTKEGIRERERELARSQRNENGDNVSAQQNQNEDMIDDEQKALLINQKDELSGEAQNAAGDEIDQDEMNSEDENEQELDSMSQNGSENGEGIIEEEKKGGEALDEDMDSPDEDNDQNVNTGAYFDEDIAVDEDEQSQNDRLQKKLTKNKQKKKAVSIQGQAKIKSKSSRNRLQSKDDSYYEYELVGVLVHSGGAEGGHYYSYIKERSGQRRWLKFDDKQVTVFDESRLGAECFGGQSGNTQTAFLEDFGGGTGGFFERSANAYLLFYQRIQPTNDEVQLVQAAQNSALDTSLRYINNIQEDIYKRIWEENAAFLKLKVFFDQEYFSFIREYIGIYNFENVLYFSQEHSESKRVQILKKLSIEYEAEVLAQTATARRNQDRVGEVEQLLKREVDYNIFGSLEKIKEDPGLNTLKLATVLSTDIIMKAKDVQSFVSWMQLMSGLFERHEIACVWFIKYITENRSILEHLLLENQMFEVRDSFSTLIKTALSVTAKNEVSYYSKMDIHFEFTKEGQALQMNSSQASTIRFMDLLLNQMLDTTRKHWRRFEEYFFVLIHFTQTGFEEVKYMIEERAIYKLLEFIANSKIPFLSTKLQMGDRGQEPDFKHVYDLLSYLVRCCLTNGIANIQEYSPVSIYQRESQHLEMTQTEKNHLISGHFFNPKLIAKQTQNTKAMLEIIQHLSWGDIKASSLYMNEIKEHIKLNTTYATVESQAPIFEIISKMLLLKDSLQQQRVSEWFQLDTLGSMNSKIFEIIRLSLPNSKVAIPLIKLFGNLALEDSKILSYLQNYKDNFQSWLLPLLESNELDSYRFDIERAYSQIFMDPNIFEKPQTNVMMDNSFEKAGDEALNTAFFGQMQNDDELDFQ